MEKVCGECEEYLRGDDVVMSTPVISIVIANYNYGFSLEATIRSVIEQECFDKCELIVVDGGSNDNSVEIIQKYSDKIAWWVSERDKGQSDAFNKGFSQAKGRLGCWLNADDLLLPGTLRTVIACLSLYDGVEWISGGTVYFKQDDKTILWMRKGSSSRFHYWNPGSFVGGPSAFFSLARLKEVGGFDVGLRFSMDSDLWWKFTRVGMRNFHIEEYFWGFGIHQASKTAYAYFSDKREDFQKEAALLRKRHGYTLRQKKIGGLLLRVIRLLTGNLLCSVISSYMWKGRALDDFVKQRKKRKDIV